MNTKETVKKGKLESGSFDSRTLYTKTLAQQGIRHLRKYS